MRVPYFAVRRPCVSLVLHLAGDDEAYAVKSADAVAALEASGLNLACQTAPL